VSFGILGKGLTVGVRVAAHPASRSAQAFSEAPTFGTCWGPHVAMGEKSPRYVQRGDSKMYRRVAATPMAQAQPMVE